MNMTSHTLIGLGMYLFIFLAFAGYPLYEASKSKHHRRRHRHAR